jgi:RimJ/RimL family protein N-acetyltransferase
MASREEPLFRLSPLAERDADEILTWSYSGELAVYSFASDSPAERDAERRDLLDPANAYHAVRDDGGELVGFCCFGPDARVPGGDYRESALDLGLGLRPDLVGQGLGTPFVQAILEFARREWSPPRFRLTVAAFNRRAMRVYERAGFEPVARFYRDTPAGAGQGAEFVVMDRES